MSSSILSIYDTLAATSITVNGTAVTVYDADQLPNSVPAAMLPVRLLTPLSTFGAEVGAQSDTIPAVSGAMYVVNWTIADVMLWRPVAVDVGVKAHAKELLDYCAEYLDMLKSLNVTMLKSVSLSPSVINYPSLSDNWYYAVRAVLAVKEDFV